MILRREPDITYFLWEYGTAAFSAKLIKNSYTTDDLTLETFKDCHCILDTNILMHIGLESSEYYTSFKVLENVFKELGINAGILYITQREYITTVQNIPESYYAFEDIIVWLRLIVMFMVLCSRIDSADANLWWGKMVRG